MTEPRSRPLIAGNWKMNGLRADGVVRVRALLRLLGPRPQADVVVCPPATLLADIAASLEGQEAVSLGAQDCHADDEGAHTGDIAAPMLADLGCRYTIVGHSERRAAHGEDDGLVARKAMAALRAGLTPIICVGETWAEREAGTHLSAIVTQVNGSLPRRDRPRPGAGGPPAGEAGRLVIAYEPVWAIGTGRTPAAADIAEAHGRLHAALAATYGADHGARVLYGGSVNRSNARGILALPGVDGALVGGASLDAEGFADIVGSCP